MMTNWEGEKDNRPFFQALVFEKDGSLNLMWLFVLIMGLVASAGFAYVLLTPRFTVIDRVAAWTMIGGSFASVLIGALPLAHAKILANAKLPGELANAISNVGRSVETSTDIQELSTTQTVRQGQVDNEG
jgi:hypothetical protein